MCGGKTVISTLYELINFRAKSYSIALSYLSGVEKMFFVSEGIGMTLDDDDLSRTRAAIDIIDIIAEDIGFRNTHYKCQRIREMLLRTEYPATGKELSVQIRELRERLEDESKDATFLHLGADQAQMYANPILNWEAVVQRFPLVKYNIEESSKCFALERYGAAVFHVLLAAEYGVIQVSTLLECQGDKPGWGRLKKLRELIAEPYPKRTPIAQTYSALLDNVVPLAYVIMDSWRHKLDHVDNQIVWMDTDFSPRVAEEIISATRAFLRKLAKELPNDR